MGVVVLDYIAFGWRGKACLPNRGMLFLESVLKAFYRGIMKNNQLRVIISISPRN